jgi:ribonucleoside-diphosphate reductase alpha chain
MDHIKMQAAFQRHCDSAVSKTINFTDAATEDHIREAYLLAYEYKLKGITVFRDGCRNEQVYYKGNTIKDKKDVGSRVALTDVKKPALKRSTPEFAVGTRVRKETGCGKLYVHVYSDTEDKEIEIFADLGKGGGCPAAFTEGVGRMSSLALKHGASIEEVRDELLGIKCPKEKGFGRYYVASCIDGMGKAIHDYVANRDEQRVSKGDVEEVSDGSAQMTLSLFAQTGACPECGGTLDFAEGCRGGKCRNPACTYFTCS